MFSLQTMSVFRVVRCIIHARVQPIQKICISTFRKKIHYTRATRGLRKKLNKRSKRNISKNSQGTITTNFKHSINQSFLRKLIFSIHFKKRPMYLYSSYIVKLWLTKLLNAFHFSDNNRKLKWDERKKVTRIWCMHEVDAFNDKKRNWMLTVYKQERKSFALFKLPCLRSNIRVVWLSDIWVIIIFYARIATAVAAIYVLSQVIRGKFKNNFPERSDGFHMQFWGKNLRTKLRPRIRRLNFWATFRLQTSFFAKR